MRVVLDVETTTLNKGNAYTKANKLVSYSVKTDETDVSFHYYLDADFLALARSRISNAPMLIGANLKFDIAWLRRVGITLVHGIRIWDVQLAAFILSGQTHSFRSLMALAEDYGLVGKVDAVAEYWEAGIDTPDIPRDVLEEYNNHDVVLTEQVYLAQLKDPRMTPELHKLILIGGADLLVLQDIEFNGLKYDADKSIETGEKLQQELIEINDGLNTIVGSAPNWDSGSHLSCILFGGTYQVDITVPTLEVYKSGPRKGEEHIVNRFKETNTFSFPGYFKPLPRTEIARSTDDRPLYQTAEPILRQLKCRTKQQKSLIEKLLRRSELAKLVDTYFFKLPELMKEMDWGEYIHGQYNQVQARTGRLSSSKPNMQNNPPQVEALFISRYAD